jgi:iron-sulfur cluster assembly accessory protein
MVQQSNDVLVAMTDRAVEKALELLRERGQGESMLRVFVAGGGCSGYQYGMAVAPGSDEGDLVMQRGDLTVIVDPQSAPLLQGAEIDFIDDPMRAGFSISNPNVPEGGGCACGAGGGGHGGGGSCC